MAKGTLYKSSNKKCGSCGSWGGARELASANMYARMIDSMGKCLNRKGKYGIGEITDGNSCNAWSKWGPLR
jgi:hypothetical protein